MAQSTTPADAGPYPDHEPSTIHRRTRQAVLAVVLLSLVAVDPVAAQENAVCNADNLPNMIEGFFQLTTALGIVGLVVVWQAESLLEMFTLDHERKKGLKRHKRSAMKSAVILVVLGPLYTVAGSMMGLPLAQCVNLVPW
ncbi:MULTISPECIES: hypothetical protein [Halolamina]|uniref:Uncharacterized protein n=1 Tax=Halolamina pelagica TaxID=699431 RepID=A0A1I5W0F4_9EURY|nr:MULTISPECIES: hypothetical protein [Halolamina]NHX36791.1 hypothetical protein [Halolamina sp. R1-12]SFQ13234.1 hypothetical protein SAMN05216277_1229 [Halolamina pelagica]